MILCMITMLCWGSWGNTQKLASRNWRFELFYWDYVLGILLFSIFSAFTLGSIGDEGRSFMTDFKQVSSSNLVSAILGGVIFNAANILLSASIAIAGMSVAFPIGIGIALILGVIVNYFGAQSGNPYFLAIGVVLIVIAILLNARAYQLKASTDQQHKSGRGISLSIVAGILMAFFYRFVAASMDLENFVQPKAGKMTPYTAFFMFAMGVFASNFIFNSYVMKKPFIGQPTGYAAYFKGSLSNHLTGIIGGIIWGLGNALNLIAAGKAGAAISYGLGQGATLVAALWGVFVWKEFSGGSRSIRAMLMAMFLFFILGLAAIIYAGF